MWVCEMCKAQFSPNLQLNCVSNLEEILEIRVLWTCSACGHENMVNASVYALRLVALEQLYPQ